MKKFSIIFILLSICIIISIFIFNSEAIKKPDYKDISLKKYHEKLKNKDNFYIYVYKTSCIACQKMKPQLNSIIKKNNIVVYAMDADVEKNLDQDFFNQNKLEKSPTLLKYERGKEVKRIEGFQNEKNIGKFLKVRGNLNK